MRVAGIIAECNPLHEGHRYLIKEARRQTGAEYLIVALSGDYVQRGAPAILSREKRALSVLEAGADLVVQLPLYVSCGGADYFARGAVKLIESLGVVTDLAFGSESGDLDLLLSASAALESETPGIRDKLQQGLRSGLSFPRARAAAFGPQEIPVSPNDLLGTEYLRALSRSGAKIAPLAVRRIPCPSASQIRGELLAAGTDRGGMTRAEADRDVYLSRDDFSEPLLHALYRAGCADDLTGYLDVSRELAGRILGGLPSFISYSDFCGLVKTRNYTYTRVSRALLHILLGMTKETMEQFDDSCGLCGWIRPVGLRRSALPLLGRISKCGAVPLIDKLSRADKLLSEDTFAVLAQELQAEYLYDLTVRVRTGGRSGPVLPAFRKPLLITD